MEGIGSYSVDMQDRSVRDYMAVRDSGGDTSQLFLYPPGSTEKEKTKIWKQRRKEIKEAEKTRKSKITDSAAEGSADIEEPGTSFGKEVQTDTDSKAKPMEPQNKIDEGKRKKERLFKRIVQRLSKAESPDDIIR